MREPSASRLKAFLRATARPEVWIGKDGERFTALVRDYPLAADGDTVTEALEALLRQVREHAETWAQAYAGRPNRQDDWGFVTAVNLMDDAELRDWLHE